jgi:mRNA deadenylase 3'-5' endonuclease subunit Ccr4
MINHGSIMIIISLSMTQMMMPLIEREMILKKCINIILTFSDNEQDESEQHNEYTETEEPHANQINDNYDYMYHNSDQDQNHTGKIGV